MLPTEIDHLQVGLVPFALGKQRLQIAFGLGDGSPRGEPPTRGEPVDVGVHRERGFPERLCHDDAGGLVPHARQGLELFERRGDAPFVTLAQKTREPRERL